MKNDYIYQSFAQNSRCYFVFCVTAVSIGKEHGNNTQNDHFQYRSLSYCFEFSGQYVCAELERIKCEESFLLQTLEFNGSFRTKVIDNINIPYKMVPILYQSFDYGIILSQNYLNYNMICVNNVDFSEHTLSMNCMCIP